MHTQLGPTQEVIVIGGGVVGLTSAWWLLEAGYRVRLVERAAGVGTAASYRNGGQLSYRYVAPLADAGVPLKALTWLLQKDGPLRFRPEADLRQWRWLRSFVAHCSGNVNRATSARLLQLGQLSRQCMAQLALEVPLSAFAWRDPGKLVVYRTPATFVAARARMERDSGAQALYAAQCVQQEPALRATESEIAGGIFTPGEAVADCHAFCQALATRLREHPRFDGFVSHEVRSFVCEGGKIIALETDESRIRADAYVLAAGIQSRTLAATASIRLPLYPLKGYSLHAPIGTQHLPPQVSVTDFERKVLFARIGDSLRVAAMVDMVGEDASLDAGRIASLTRLARVTLPNAADYAASVPWAGLRPATPDGAPIIGATRYPNLWLNVGHGPLGFTFACGSARVLAGAMRAEAPPFAMEGLQLRA